MYCALKMQKVYCTMSDVPKVQLVGYVEVGDASI